MIGQPYSQLVRYKRWADRDLYEVIGRSFDKLPQDSAAILLRILDHIQAVDRIFQHHLQGLPHGYRAPHSESVPDFQALADGARQIDDWYVSYVSGLTETGFAQPVDLTLTSGKPMRMRRGEIILHVCLHGTYHRGNVGVILRKHGIAPGRDVLTDFLDDAI